MVLDFVGQPRYEERKKYIEGERPSGQKVEVTFIDGEVLVGTTLGCSPKRQDKAFSSFQQIPKATT
jgi:hypothetical protein